jgi:hypothetical protein
MYNGIFYQSTAIRQYMKGGYPFLGDGLALRKERY